MEKDMNDLEIVYTSAKYREYKSVLVRKKICLVSERESWGCTVLVQNNGGSLFCLSPGPTVSVSGVELQGQRKPPILC